MNDYKIIVSLGSNTNAASNIEKARFLLHKLLPGISYSKVLITEPIDLDSDNFMNCIGVARCVHNHSQMIRAFKNIENLMGSGKGEHGRGIVRIDLDLLYLGGQKYHEADWNRPYIRQLLTEMGEKDLIEMP